MVYDIENAWMNPMLIIKKDLLSDQENLIGLDSGIGSSKDNH